MQACAIIDLGTNTFNLLIAEIRKDNTFHIIQNKRLYVKLGEKGINKGLITNAAIERALNALEQYNELITIHKITNIHVFATSGIRTASNADEFIHIIEKKYNFKVNIISGDKEAEYIYYGIKQSVPLTEQKVLILDIGGGSVELIVANKHKVFWKNSYKIGVARLLEKFNPSDPITKEELSKIENYISSVYIYLRKVYKQYPFEMLIGASGSFETFTEMIMHNNKDGIIPIDGYPSVEIKKKDYLDLHHILIRSTAKERESMKGLPAMRREYIALASIIVNYTIKYFQIKTIIQSDFALKEGVIYKLLNFKH